MAQSGRALRSGRRGPRFESGRPDKYSGGCRFNVLERPDSAARADVRALLFTGVRGPPRERWQNGYCTRLESVRPRGLGGSNPSRSVECSEALQCRVTWRVFRSSQPSGGVRSPEGFDSTRGGVIGDRGVYRGEDRGSAGGGPQINPSRSVASIEALLVE